MRYTPVELRHVRLGRSFFGGYKRAEADMLLSDVADSFEDVWRERGELADRLEEVEKHLDEVKQRETLLASTLIAAERTAAEAVEAAKRQGEVIIAEAHQESRSITRAAQNERERLFAEARRVETLLRAALGMVEETHVEAAVEPGASGHGSAWPNRENTSEFKAVSEEQLAADADADGAEEGEAVDGSAELPPVQDEVGVEDDGPRPGRDFAWG